jgi:hypothetical protein
MLQAKVFKIILVIDFKKPFPGDIITVNFIDQVGGFEKKEIVNDRSYRNRYLLGFEKVTDAIGRNQVARIISNECGQIVEETEIPDIEALRNIPEQNGIQYIP